MEALLDGIIMAAESTAKQASGNDQTDWNNFANALRVVRKNMQDAAAQAPKPTPHK
jgi:hypothetical protein